MRKKTNIFLGLFLTVIISVISTPITSLAQNELDIYGYFATRLEKQFDTKSSSGTVAEGSLYEWAYPSLNIMMQHQINDNFKVFININGAKASTLDIRNYWGEYSYNNQLNIRLGKIYRKFGLYNEILDAVPTYYGIEPPELFDTDHLMISRTTTLMVYGNFDLGSGNFNYSFTTDDGEGGAIEGAVPLGYDFNYKFLGGDFVLGTSGYVSGGDAVPDIAVGKGSPKSGVLPWMSTDHFNIMGGYAEFTYGSLLVQTEFWNSSHKAKRDPGSVITLAQDAGLNAAQLERFLKDPEKDVTTLTDDDVVQTADFNIQTWYVRAGYSFETSIGEVAPYVQWDWYSNPETIESKTYGGDAEAGASDDGVFNKSTLGVVFRPVPEVAVKFDQSYHFYKAGGESVNYPEIRLDVSYIFGN
ncbi:MAG: hypothetical protein V1720_01660 [bacterium]